MDLTVITSHCDFNSVLGLQAVEGGVVMDSREEATAKEDVEP